MIAIYVRVSTEMQRDNYSVAAQKDKGKSFALLQKQTYEVYDDTESGSTITERREFLRLLEDIRTRKITMLWAIEFSRLSRNIDDALFIRKVLIENHVRLFIADQEIDISSPEAVLSYNLKSSIADYERSMIASRVKRAKKQQQDSGEFIHSSLLGYSSKFSETGERKWFVDEKEAEIVRLIFNMYSEGKSLQKIANYLNDNGFKTKRKRVFTATTVTKVLTHPEYFGKILDSSDKLIDSKVYAPILDSSLLTIIEQARNSRSIAKERFRSSKNALSNVLRCARCGAAYYVHRMQEKSGLLRERYAHRADSTVQSKCDQPYKYIAKFHIEKLAELCYYYLFKNQQLIVEYAKKKKAELFLAKEGIFNQLQEQDSLLSEIDVKRKRLIDAVRDGVLVLDDIKSSIAELNKEKTAIEATKKTLESSLITIESDHTIREFVFDNVSAFMDMDEARKKNIYKEIFEEFSIDGDMITIRYFFGLKLTFSYNDVRVGDYEEMDSFKEIIPMMFTSNHWD